MADADDEFAVLDDKEEMRMSFIFAVNGCVGVVREWIRTDFSYPVDRISRLIVDMAFRSVGLPEK